VYILRSSRCHIEIRFRDQELEQAFRHEAEARRRFGKVARPFLRRVKQLEAAPTLAALNGTPAACRSLSGTQGVFAVWLSERIHLVFAADQDHIPLLLDGAPDQSRVTQIKIWSVENVHA